MDIMHYLSVVKGSVIRYIKIDLKYLFQIVTDVVWFLLDIVAFAFLGAFMDDKTNTGELGLEGLNMVTFMLIGVLFWAFFHRAYEDTVNTIPEEASRGTIGFLVTNNVNISTLLIARNIASTIKTGLMAILIILPVLALYPVLVGATPSDIDEFEGTGEGLTITGVIELNGTMGGNFTSEVMKTVPGGEWDSIAFDVEIPAGTQINAYIRTDDDNESWGAWVLKESNISMGQEIAIQDVNNRYMQYKLEINSSDKITTPIVKGATIKKIEPIIALENPGQDLLAIIGVFLMIWVFMLVISFLISSLNIIFKRITPFAVMFMYGLKILSGYYFPVEAINIPGVADAVKYIPVTAGLYMIRGVMSGHPNNIAEYTQSMIIGTIFMGIISFVVYKYLEGKSQTWGTLEFY